MFDRIFGTQRTGSVNSLSKGLQHFGLKIDPSVFSSTLLFCNKYDTDRIALVDEPAIAEIEPHMRSICKAFLEGKRAKLQWCRDIDVPMLLVNGSTRSSGAKRNFVGGMVLTPEGGVMCALLERHSHGGAIDREPAVIGKLNHRGRCVENHLITTPRNQQRFARHR